MTELIARPLTMLTPWQPVRAARTRRRMRLRSHL